MSAAGPLPRRSLPLEGEGAQRQGGPTLSAAGPSQGFGERRAAPSSPRPPGGSERSSHRGDHIRPLLQEGVCEVREAASLGEVQ